MRRLFCLVGLLVLGSAAMAVEEPKYEIVVQDAGFEVRRYAPFIVAETWVDGDMDAASGKGFRAIADYIFGNNKSPQSAASSKIAMTAPVVMQPATEANGMVGAQRWRVHFVMPSEYTLAALPTPINGAVTLREVPATLVAVAKYSGFNTERRIHEETLALAAWMETRKLAAVGTAKLARYDPPWTLPMWRRNEIHMEMLPSTAR